MQQKFYRMKRPKCFDGRFFFSAIDAEKKFMKMRNNVNEIWLKLKQSVLDNRKTGRSAND